MQLTEEYEVVEIYKHGDELIEIGAVKKNGNIVHYDVYSWHIGDDAKKLIFHEEDPLPGDRGFQFVVETLVHMLDN